MSARAARVESTRMEWTAAATFDNLQTPSERRAALAPTVDELIQRFAQTDGATLTARPAVHH